jgi:hypothetical protein
MYSVNLSVLYVDVPFTCISINCHGRISFDLPYRIYICVHVRICVCTYMHPSKHTYIYIYVGTHIHIHILYVPAYIYFNMFYVYDDTVVLDVRYLLFQYIY